MSSRTYEESLESIDARIEQLRARRRDEVARHERRERSARSCACTALGEAVLAWYGDWRSLDPGRFAEMLAGLAPRRPELAARGAGGGAPTTGEALRAYRELRRDAAEAEAPGEGRERGGLS